MTSGGSTVAFLLFARCIAESRSIQIRGFPQIHIVFSTFVIFVVVIQFHGTLVYVFAGLQSFHLVAQIGDRSRLLQLLS